MKLHEYYDKLRQKEAEISGKDIYVTSLVTGDGGKEGVVTQVPKRLGCQLMVEGKARLASEEEVQAYLEEQEARRVEIESQVYAQRLHRRAAKIEALESLPCEFFNAWGKVDCATALKDTPEDFPRLACDRCAKLAELKGGRG